jgi:hypothetical protein
MLLSELFVCFKQKLWHTTGLPGNGSDNAVVARRRRCIHIHLVNTDMC